MKSNILSCCLALMLPAALMAGGCGGDSIGCEIGWSKCNGVCVDTTSDPANCGTCGTTCPDGQYCAVGVCVCSPVCNMGEKQCATANQYQVCGDPDGDGCYEWEPAVACGAGEVCVDGECYTSCTDECSREDARGCDSGGANGYRICGDYDADDCLEWGQLVPCGAGTECVDGQCVDSCVDECFNAGDRTCAEPPDNGFVICGDYDADSCLEWGSLTLCPQGQTCSAGACSSDCTEDCTAGQRMCDGNGYRTCGSYDADPCMDWSGITDCASWEVCVGGYCEIACSEECGQGTKQCSGEGADEGFDVCGNYDADPCLEWGNHTPCGAGEKCENGFCVEDCTDECPNNGARICDGDGYRTCRANVDPDSCLEWSEITACPAGESCSGDGVCSEFCVNPCPEGESECFGAGWRECVAHASIADCWVWSAVTPCGDFEICNPDTVECVLSCSDECPGGGTRTCTADLTGYMTCAAAWDADPCLEWSVPTPCPALQECDPATGQCVLSCSDECGPVGFLRCTVGGLGFEECDDHDADGCLEWGNYIDCPAGETCSNGVCALDCSDECDSDGQVVCSADDPTRKTYRICGDYDPDVCLELGSPATCDYGQLCQDGSGCVVVCTDDCPALGELRCNGLDVEVCAVHDADECLEWDIQASCDPASQLCYNGNCVADTPPTIVLVNEVLYNNVGDDYQDGNFLFIELYGVGDQDLANYSLVGINGNSGVEAEYMTIPLDGYTIPADGHFLVAHPDGDANLVAVADLLTTAVDLQNGPDSLQVRWAGTEVVDALGYGDFAAGDRWAGEGADYTEAAPAADPVDDVMYCLSRGADHADTDVNANDFYRRTGNNCSPGWDGPGAILAQSYVWGGNSTPAIDALGHVWTVDSWGDINVTYPTLVDSEYFTELAADFISSVAVNYDGDPPQIFVGSDAGVYGYQVDVVSADPYVVDISIIPGTSWPVETGWAVLSTPAISYEDGAVFFGSQGGGFFGYNADGTWRFTYDTGGKWVDSSPALGYLANGDEVVIFGVGDIGGAGELVALYASANNLAGQPAGAEVWRVIGFGGGCNSSPAVAGGVVYIGCDDGVLYSFDIEDGTQAIVVDISSGGTVAEVVQGCSPVVMPDGLGNTLISMTSRSDAGDLYLLEWDGAAVGGLYYDWDMLMSSPALGEDGSTTVHAGPFLFNFAADGSMQWYAVVSSDYPADDWIHSSPTWVSLVGGGGAILVVDPFDGDLWTILASVGPGAVVGSYPMFHGNSYNSGLGW